MMTFILACTRRLNSGLPVLCCLLLSAFTETHHLQPGQRCYNIQYDKTGICTTLNNCPWAEKEINYGRVPDMCATVANVPSQLVCCLTCDEHHEDEHRIREYHYEPVHTATDATERQKHHHQEGEEEEEEQHHNNHKHHNNQNNDDDVDDHHHHNNNKPYHHQHHPNNDQADRHNNNNPARHELAPGAVPVTYKQDDGDHTDWTSPRYWPDTPIPNPPRLPPPLHVPYPSQVNSGRPPRVRIASVNNNNSNNNNNNSIISSKKNNSSSISSSSKSFAPGERAKKMCVVYEQYVPTKRRGKYNECLQNHTALLGGHHAVGKEFPHMALLGYGKRNALEYNCGGSLIAPTFVLTAAHCLFDATNQPVEWVLLGELDLTDTSDDANPQHIRVKERIRHPDYKVMVLYNDVALLRLEKAPDMTTEHVRPACLNTEKNLPVQDLKLTGWGRMEYEGPQSDSLLEVSLRTTAYDACKEDYETVPKSKMPQGIDDSSQLCAGKNVLKKDACQGDSGGPLQIPQDIVTCMYVIAGIVSFGQGCGTGVAGVYTRVSHYVPWIEDIVWPKGS